MSKIKIKNLARAILVGALLNVGPHASGQLTATVQPGYVFANGERPTTATLNQLGQPTISVSGTLTGSSGLAAGTVTGVQLANSVPDGVTLNYNTSSPRQLRIVPAVSGSGGGVSVSQVNSNICGAGLAGGSGSQLYVTNAAANQLRVPTNTIVGGVTNGTNGLVAASAIPLGPGLAISNSVLTLGSNVLVNTSAGVVTNFTSGEKSLVSGQIDNEAHGLPGTPRSVSWVLVCKTAEFGFAIGDEVASQFVALSGANGAVLTGGGNSTNVWLSCETASAISACRKDTGSRVALTAANWKAKCYASYSY